MPTTTTAVTDLMTGRVFAVEPDDDLSSVWTVMVDHNVRHVPVVDSDGDLVGLISHRDLLRAALVEHDDVPPMIERDLLERTKARGVMTRDVEWVEPTTDAAEAARILIENKYGCLPVLEGRRLVGILTEADFVRRYAEELAAR